MALMLVIFCISGAVIYRVYRQYRSEDALYEQAAESFTSRVDSGAGEEASGEKSSKDGDSAVEEKKECAPIEVDFESLIESGGDVVGWLYCEDTKINYPLVKGENNSFYLNHSYDKSKLNAGAVFVDANNRDIFEDSNTIIYGHHMQDGTMFAGLHSWMEEGYYEEHPVFWLLTPEQDYKVLLFAGYTTPATSDTYTIYPGAGEELDNYLKRCVERSDFRADVDLDGQGKYVVFSTCSYVYTDARYVLHGVLVPVERQGADGEM